MVKLRFGARELLCMLVEETFDLRERSQITDEE